MSIFGSDRVDLRSAENVCITIDQTSDGVQLWVDVDGHGCLTRIYRIKHLSIIDRRTGVKDDAEPA